MNELPLGVANVNGELWAIGRSNEKMSRVEWDKRDKVWRYHDTGKLVVVSSISTEELSDLEWITTEYVTEKSIETVDYLDLLREIDISDGEGP